MVIRDKVLIEFKESGKYKTDHGVFEEIEEGEVREVPKQILNAFPEECYEIIDTSMSLSQYLETNPEGALELSDKMEKRQAEEANRKNDPPVLSTDSMSLNRNPKGTPVRMKKKPSRKRRRAKERPGRPGVGG